MKHVSAFGICIAAAMMVVVGCGGNELTPSSQIVKLRVLSVVTDPPLAHCGDTVDVAALAVNEDGSVAQSATYLWALTTQSINPNDPQPEEVAPLTFSIGREATLAIPEELSFDCNAGGTLYAFLFVIREEIDLTSMGGDSSIDMFASLLTSNQTAVGIRTIPVVPPDSKEVNTNPRIETVTLTFPDDTQAIPLLQHYPDSTLANAAIAISPEFEGTTVSFALVAADDEQASGDFVANWFSTSDFPPRNKLIIDWDVPLWQDPATYKRPDNMPEGLPGELKDPKLYPVYTVVRDNAGGQQWKGFFVRICPPEGC